MTKADYNLLIPNQILFSIKEIDEMNLIKSDMLKKLIYRGEIEVVKIGKKNFFSKVALVAYLESNTVPVRN